MGIHLGDDGTYTISAGGMWLPGIYDSARAARYGFRVDDACLQQLADSRDTARQPITFDELRAARRSGVALPAPPEPGPVGVAIDSAAPGGDFSVLWTAGGNVFIAPVGTVEPGAGQPPAGWIDLGYVTEDSASIGTMSRWRGAVLSAGSCRLPRDVYEWATATPEQVAEWSAPHHHVQAEARTRPGSPRDDPGTPSPPADILDRIDDVVEERCACGCGRSLDPDGPSGFFASAHCQQLWHGRQVTDPAAVYGREDAAVVWVGHDDRPVPLNGASREDDVDPPDAGTAATGRYECPDLYGAAYRLDCRACGRNTIPVVVYEDEDVDVDVDEFGPPRPRVALLPVLRQECGHCAEPIPGPVYVADVAETRPGVLTLLLADPGRSRATHRIRVAELIAMRDPAVAVATFWDRLHRQLGQFTNGFYRSVAEDRIVAACITPESVFRGIGLA